MNKKTLISICLFGMATSFTYARYHSSIAQNCDCIISSVENIVVLTLQRREKENDSELKNPLPKSLVPTPEVTMQAGTLHFITPCYGYEFLLVQDDVVCYSAEIDDETLTIPATIHGTYELQIVGEYYIFYTEVTLP